MPFANGRAKKKKKKKIGSKSNCSAQTENWRHGFLIYANARSYLDIDSIERGQWKGGGAVDRKINNFYLVSARTKQPNWISEWDHERGKLVVNQLPIEVEAIWNSKI